MPEAAVPAAARSTTSGLHYGLPHGVAIGGVIVPHDGPACDPAGKASRCVPMVAVPHTQATRAPLHDERWNLHRVREPARHAGHLSPPAFDLDPVFHVRFGAAAAFQIAEPHQHGSDPMSGLPPEPGTQPRVGPWATLQVEVDPVL